MLAKILNTVFYILCWITSGAAIAIAIATIIALNSCALPGIEKYPSSTPKPFPTRKPSVRSPDVRLCGKFIFTHQVGETVLTFTGTTDVIMKFYNRMDKVSFSNELVMSIKDNEYITTWYNTGDPIAHFGQFKDAHYYFVDGNFVVDVIDGFGVPRTHTFKKVVM